MNSSPQKTKPIFVQKRNANALESVTVIQS